MSKLIDGTTIITYQGDSFSLTFTDLTPGDKIYFGIRDKKYNSLMFKELNKTVDSEGEVTFVVDSEKSNKLLVKSGEPCAVYYYGIKQVDTETGEENTIVLGDEGSFEDKYIIRVLAKKVEGPTNE